ncbi:MAG: hypothetical protein ABW252_24685 [Polyangiales bacterium]
MTSPSTTLSLGLLAAFAPLLASASPAHAADAEPAVRWAPERSWPGACETDVPTNGLVFLEGAARGSDLESGEGTLRVFVQRMEGESPVETIDGNVSFPDATSAVFQASHALAPNADYQLTAQRVSPDGTLLSAPFTSDFTTGSNTLAAPSFRGAPTMQVEAFDKELERCDGARCVPTGETEPARFLRVAVPAIEGGLAQRPYAVSAALSASAHGSQAKVVATADDAAVQAGKRSFMVIEVPALPENVEGCVTVTARDLAGHEVRSEPVCTQLAAAAESEGEASALQYAQGGDAEAEAAMPADTAGGCAVGTRGAGAGSLAWLALALTFSRARFRKRAR